MAQAKSIGRLYQGPHEMGASETPEAKSPPGFEAKTEPSMLDLYTRSLMVPVRRRFGSPRGALTAPAIQSTVHPAAAVDRNSAFADLAARDRAAVAMRAAVGRWQERQAERGAGHQPWPMAIQI